jgi:hypothetical protein
VQKLTAVDLFERVSVDNPYMVQMKLSEAESEELRNLREDLEDLRVKPRGRCEPKWTHCHIVSRILIV